jgi:hypothetical protein
MESVLKSGNPEFELHLAIQEFMTREIGERTRKVEI